MILTPKLTYSSTKRAVLNPSSMPNVVDTSYTLYESNPDLWEASQGWEPPTQSLLKMMSEDKNYATIGIHKNSKQSKTTNIFKNSPFEMSDGSNHTYFLGGNSL